MAEIHSLILKSDSTQIRQSSDDLDKLSNSATKAEGNTNNLSKSSKDASDAFAGMKTAIASVIGALGARELIQYADTWNLVESRLKLATNSASEFAKAQSELFEIAQNTRQGFAETSDLYARMARSTKELGLSQADLLSVTESVNKALVISGASTAEAASVTTQLSQAMASGVLRGEEFNSISENGSRIMDVLADSLGKNRGELRKMAEEGKLTAEIVAKALLDQSSKIDSEFSKITKTVGQSWVQVENSAMKAIAELDKTTGATKSLSDALTSLSKNIDGVVEITGVAVSLYAAFKVDGWINAGVATLGSSFLAVNSGVDKALATSLLFEASLKRMAAFASANPILVTVAFAAILSESFTAVRDFIEGEKVNEAGSTILRKSIENMKELSSVEAQARLVGANYNQLSETLNKQLEQRAKLVEANISTANIDAAITKTKQALKDTQSVAKEFYSIMGIADEKASPSKTQSASTSTIKKAIDNKKELEIKAAMEASEAIYKYEQDLLNEKLNGSVLFYDAQVQRYYEYIATLEEQKGRLLESFNPFLALNNQNEEQASIIEEAFQNRLITEQERSSLLLSVEDDYQQKLMQLFRSGAADREEFAKLSAVNQTNVVLGEMVRMTQGMATSNKAMFEINKIASAAQATLNAYEAATSAYAWGSKLGGPPLGAIMAGIALAAQVAQVRAILSSSYGGSSVAPSQIGSGVSTTVATTPTQTTQQQAVAPQNVTINLGPDNTLISTESVRRLIEQISDTAGDMGVIIKVAS